MLRLMKPTWEEILFGVSQGSILAPLRFNIFICDRAPINFLKVSRNFLQKAGEFGGMLRTSLTGLSFNTLAVMEP